MKKVPNQIKKYRIIFRAVVLCALLSGLLISCSEGIRLFPFPTAEISTTDEAVQSTEIELAYQFNAHRFEDFGRQKQKTKSLPDNFHRFSLDISGLFKSFSFRVNSKNEAENFAVSITFKPPLFSKSGEGRAPPFAA
jgi:hypothetical protein